MEPESGDRGCTGSISSWDSRGKFNMGIFSKSLLYWGEYLLLGGERARSLAAKVSLGGATNCSLVIGETDVERDGGDTSLVSGGE